MKPIVYFFVLVVLCASCKKTRTPQQPQPQVQQTYLKKETWTYPGGTIIKEYVYDQQLRRPLKINGYNGNGTLTTVWSFEYNAAGNVVKTTKTEQENQETDVWTISYDNNNRVQRIESLDQGESIPDVSTFAYSDNTISETVTARQGRLTYTATYIFSNGNLVSHSVIESPSDKTRYSYSDFDSNKNPFKGLPLGIFQYSTFMDMPPIAFMANNYRNVKIDYPGSSDEEYSVDCQYNTDGYLTRKIRSGRTDTLRYEYVKF